MTARSLHTDWPLLRAASIPLLVGALVRIAPVAGNAFPLNDGGMFYVLVQELVGHGFALPTLAHYNGLAIPFAYPPLGFYLAGLAAVALHLPLLTVFRFEPLVFSLATLPVFWLIAEELLPTRFHVLVAMFAFALLPRAFEWEIAGGGITRSPGYLFGMLAIYGTLRLLRSGGPRWILWTALFSGLTALTHPEALVATAAAIGLLALLRCRSSRALAELTLAGVGALAVASPWLTLVLVRYGPAALVSAASTGPNALGGAFALLLFDFTGEPFWHLLAGLGLLGLLVEAARRRWFLPLWVVVCFLLDSRGASSYTAVPLGLLASIGLADAVLPALFGAPVRWVASELWPGALRQRRFVSGVLVLTFAMSLTSSLLLQTDTGGPVHALAPDNLAAMAWVRANVPSGSAFVIVSGSNWWNDATSEWFPALTDQRSVATLQGYEWLGLSAWQRQSKSAAALQKCAGAGLQCIEAWSATYRAPLNYLYLPKGRLLGPLSPSDCCTTLRIELAQDPGYREIHDGSGATVFQRVNGAP
jgi:hypothetical protein